MSDLYREHIEPFRVLIRTGTGALCEPGGKLVEATRIAEIHLQEHGATDAQAMGRLADEIGERLTAFDPAHHVLCFELAPAVRPKGCRKARCTITVFERDG